MTFICSQKQQLLDSLENQIFYGDILSLVIGHKGLGKTFLLDQLQKRLSNKIYHVHVDGDLGLNQNQLDKTIALQLGLSWQQNEGDLLSQIRQTCNNRVLLTIDNADRLSLSCLSYLAELANQQKQANDVILYFVLAGESNLASNLAETPQLKVSPQLCAVFEVKPILGEETSSYLADKQKSTVTAIESLLGQQKLDYLWKLGKGSPAELNRQLARWLEEAPQASKINLTAAHYLKASLYGLVALSLILVLIYQDEINQFISPAKQVERSVLFSKEMAEITQRPIEPDIRNNEVIENEILSDGTLTIGTESVLSESSVPVVIENRLNPESSMVTETLSEANDLALEEYNNAQTERAEVGAEIVSDEEVVQAHLDNNNELNQDNSGQASPSQASAETTGPTSAPQASGQSPVTQEELNLARLSEDETFLLGLNEGDFILQWMAVSSLRAAQDFKNSHPLNNELYIYRRDLAEKQLFLIVGRVNSNKATLDQEKNQFARLNYPGKSWIKQVKVIQKEIRRFARQ